MHFHRTSFSSSCRGSRSVSRVGSGRLLTYQRDVSDSIFSDSNSPSDSFRAPQWTPVAQGGSIGDFIAAGSDQIVDLKARSAVNLTGKEESNSPHSMSVQAASASLPSVLQRNPSGGCSFMAKPFYPLPSQPLSGQSSDSRISTSNVVGSSQMASLEGRRPSQMLGSNGEFTQRMAGCSIDWWSMQTISEPVTSSRRGLSNASSELKWDLRQECSDPFAMPAMGRIRATVPQMSVSQAISITFHREAQKCDLCSRWLSQRSPWCPHRLLGNSDLPVVAVLCCGHLYHAECLDQATPEAHMHDPPCPQCHSVEKVGPKMQGQSDLTSFSGQAPVRSKLSRIGIEIDDTAGPELRSRNSYSDGKSIFSIDFRKKGSLQTSALRDERSFFSKPFLKRQFSFRSKSSKDQPLNNLGMRKLGSPAQVSPENSFADDINKERKGQWTSCQFLKRL